MKLKIFIISDPSTHLFSLKTKVFSCCTYATTSCLGEQQTKCILNWTVKFRYLWVAWSVAGDGGDDENADDDCDDGDNDDDCDDDDAYADGIGIIEK